MRTVVFDLDGTLVDTAADLVAAANVCFRARGLGDVLDARADARTAFRGARAMLRAGFERAGQGGEAEVDADYPRLLEAYGAAIAVHSRPYDGAWGAVETLKARGFAVAICTNKPEALAIRLMDAMGTRHVLPALVGADTLPVSKPDPAPYLEAVRRAGGDPDRSILVGDTETDARTARAAGVPIVLVGFGPEGAGVSRMAPDAVLEHFDDLPDLALRLLP
ncbi:HAD-IA family hydrolase [Palleronia rufa]|uniref:HAD-IA family hydrolase n=1 Tax=Palleronia rufa TaxID=1530186 RepID=UPI00056C17A7|nr:HAD-IA family hydrolase [Palleronia rufa]